MLEAKAALKCLFDILIEAKRELQNQSEKGYQARYEEIKESFDRLSLEFENSKAEFERQLATIKIQNEQKVRFFAIVLLFVLYCQFFYAVFYFPYFRLFIMFLIMTNYEIKLMDMQFSVICENVEFRLLAIGYA